MRDEQTARARAGEARGQRATWEWRVSGAGAQVAGGIKWIKHTRSAHEGAASNCLSTVIQRQRSKAGAQKREPKQGDGGQRQAATAGAEQLVGTGEGSRKGSKSTEADSMPWKGSRGAQRRRAVLEAGRCGNGGYTKQKNGGRQRRIEAMGVLGRQARGGLLQETWMIARRTGSGEPWEQERERRRRRGRSSAPGTDAASWRVLRGAQGGAGSEGAREWDGNNSADKERSSAPSGPQAQRRAPCEGITRGARQRWKRGSAVKGSRSLNRRGTAAIWEAHCRASSPQKVREGTGLRQDFEGHSVS
ncbi:hypothetical protein DFH08DRAFT_1022362 [Mycena albidolilacea]|uniref:Uncharacterized protein n=1 Tax=Mycena albidolilacea TaxID=1033008 RepID=A0AAD6ZNU8_9AGAR|nr:hypothetical protein DFH08DRAFT_1022362 [Mycena albidolilacea]